MKLKKRLQFWIELWKKKNNREMSLIAQMNLFSELYVLLDLTFVSIFNIFLDDNSSYPWFNNSWS